LKRLYDVWGGVQSAVNPATVILECTCPAALVEAAEQARARCIVDWSSFPTHSAAQLRTAPVDEVRLWLMMLLMPEQLRCACLCQVMMLQMYQRHMHELRPDWQGLQAAGLLRVVHSSGNGNCIFNSASLLLCGSERLHVVLRLLTVVEVILNVQTYLGLPNAAFHRAIIQQQHELGLVSCCYLAGCSSCVHVSTLACVLCRWLNTGTPFCTTCCASGGMSRVWLQHPCLLRWARSHCLLPELHAEIATHSMHARPVPSCHAALTLVWQSSSPDPSRRGGSATHFVPVACAPDVLAGNQLSPVQETSSTQWVVRAGGHNFQALVGREGLIMRQLMYVCLPLPDSKCVGCGVGKVPGRAQSSSQVCHGGVVARAGGRGK
jgi:hypothetical protein